jgi:multiple sugar transport system permease protein
MTLVAESAAPERMQRRELSDRAFAWLLIAPALLFIAVIVVWPLIETIRLSFTDATLGGENWVGVANYAALFADPKFWQTVGRTFYWMALAVSLKLIVGLIGASFLDTAIPGKALFRVLVMPPWVIPVAICVIGWKWMYNGYFGLISGLLQEFGLIQGRVALLANKTSAFFSAIITETWAKLDTHGLRI